MMAAQELKKKKKPSKKLQNILDGIEEESTSFQKQTLQPKIDEAFSVGKEEGFTDLEIGDLIREKLKASGYTARWVAKLLPTTAKHQEKVRDTRKPVFNSSDELSSSNEHENDTTKPSLETFSQETQPIVPVPIPTNTQTESKSDSKIKLFQDTIATKSKLLKQKDEEIAGLKKQHSNDQKKIAQLEKEVAKRDKEIAKIKDKLEDKTYEASMYRMMKTGITKTDQKKFKDNWNKKGGIGDQIGERLSNIGNDTN